jgi:RNA-splicing ligase RtcB
VQRAAEVVGLRDRHIAFLSHCGSRGFGNVLAQNQFKDLERKFEKWSTPFPANDKKLVYAPLGTPDAIIAKVSADLKTVQQKKEMIDRYRQLGSFVGNMGPEELVAYARSEQEMWRPILQKLADTEMK